jgi:hypothetical protein
MGISNRIEKKYLDEELEVNILALRSSTPGLLALSTGN